jgi:hypothetical protein
MKFTFPQQRSSIENSPSLNKDHPTKTCPSSTKIIQWKLTLPQQRSPNENLPSLNKANPFICWERRSFIGWSLLREGKFSLDDICWGRGSLNGLALLREDHPMKTYPSSTKIIQWNSHSLNKYHPIKLTLPQQRSSNENLPPLNKDHPKKTYPPSTKIIQRNSPSLNKYHFIGWSLLREGESR